MSIREIFALICFLIAIIFGLGGIIGLFRFRDPYSRLHAGSLCGTTCALSTFFGLLLLSSSIGMATRIVVIIVFFLISAPTGSSIVGRFIWESNDTEQTKKKKEQVL
ncbi:MAG: monovalent cation/H(+) antiporter subunit G [Sphaerochaeta sp.]|nr:monovalent cation/H(+) antiporter subunit G [Sphaerochaeta sp.]